MVGICPQAHLPRTQVHLSDAPERSGRRPFTLIFFFFFNRNRGRFPLRSSASKIRLNPQKPPVSYGYGFIATGLDSYGPKCYTLDRPKTHLTTIFTSYSLSLSISSPIFLVYQLSMNPVMEPFTKSSTSLSSAGSYDNSRKPFWSSRVSEYL